ncbi:MAG: DNA repair protein RecN [Candidatus Aminicenantes bacterium]|nr:DNA repair protein RecN [Candidatus Aminicenantes bacterium]
MIKSLRIQNLATIEDIELDFEEGFSILTGETGVGKSIIIGGILLILGEKSSRDMIRTGENEISVEAVFQPGGCFPAREEFPPYSEDGLFIHRKISDKITAKGYVNGVLVPLKKLKELSFYLVDIYGQNDHIFLQQVENHLLYLDAYANTSDLRLELEQITRELKRLVRSKNEIEYRNREREQRLDFLRYQIMEIEKACLEPGEEDALKQERNILKNAERIRQLVEETLNIVDGEEASISSLLPRLLNTLHELSGYAEEFREASHSIGQFAITIREFSDSLHQFHDRHTESPKKLDEIEERMSLIERLKRKYGSSVEGILAYLEKAKIEFEDLNQSQDKLSELGAKILKQFESYKSAAERLSDSRKTHARNLEADIEKEIEQLGMRKAKFRINILSTTPDPGHVEKLKSNGIDDVEFLISPNPGEDPKPLRRIASGGELSRIMLALKSIGKDGEKMKTLIFDEIDSGIGGKTAEFVAQKLKGLSIDNQVLCITHLPQIASFAAHHFKIEKKVSANRTFTTVKKLNFEERTEEIARLSAGSHISEAALQNAREMLERNLKFVGRTKG